jgi:hypothetical protein
MSTPATKYLVITTKPFPGETKPQRWIIQMGCYFSVERGRLGDTYLAEKYLEKHGDSLPEVRLYPIAPDAEIKEHIHPIVRGTTPYSPGNPQPPLAPFIHRKRELPEFHFELRVPNVPQYRGHCYPRPAYSTNLTPGQRDALVETFAEELTAAVIQLAPEIRRRIRQQVIDKLREQAAEARSEADKAEAFANSITA